MSSYIYFITAGDIAQDDAPVKIGITRDPPVRRLAALQGAHHAELSVAFAIETRDHEKTRRAERVLHRVFAHRHIRGEWFRACPTLRALISDFQTDREDAWRSLAVEGRKAGISPLPRTALPG